MMNFMIYTIIAVTKFCQIIAYECEMSAETCVTSLDITARLTMMHPSKFAVYPKGGKLYRYDVTNVSSSNPIDIGNIITADGWETTRLLSVANDSMPGPPIIVYEGQRVIIRVSNKLKSEEVTIHWHGLPQVGTPFMDGVPFLTQCPILTGQTFVYDFKASHKGTYWYHSHIGAQRSNGLFGAFVIRERKTLEMEEHIMTIQEWNHDWDADMEDAKMNLGAYEDRKKFKSSQSLDGQFFSNVKAQSGLINGLGRFWEDSTHNEAPLATFNVQQDRYYRFRVIGAGTLYPWIISVDNHNLTIIATDGFDTEPQTANSFIINVGERYDFTIFTDQPISNYWIRGQTLESNRNTTAEAILHYDGANNEDPNSMPRKCTEGNRCLIVNCFFPYYPESLYTDCLSVDRLKHKSNSDPAPPVRPGKFKEYFLNFAFPGITAFPSTINGKQFIFPAENALTDPDDIDFPCELQDCGEQKLCSCTHSLAIDHDDTIQMIFLNMGQGTGWAHPIHMHGHTFYVLKMGYGLNDNKTGLRTGGNPDIDCRGGTDMMNSFCNSATWSDSSWANGNVPGLELQKPVRKDTIIVPSGGYVVTRIIADNPGVWFLHCHIELHANDGMAMILNESFPYHPSPPKGFPHCHNFPDNERILDLPSSTGTKTSPASTTFAMSSEEITSDFYSEKNFWIIVGVLIGLIFIQFSIIVYLCRVSVKDSNKSYNFNGKSNPNFSY